MQKLVLWKPGDQAVIRGVTETGAIVTGKAVTVIEDSSERTALYFPVGSPFERRLRRKVNGRYLDDSRTEWRSFVIKGNDILMLFYPSKLYAIWLMWNHATGHFVQWYADLQTEPRRTEIGFDRYDLDLDVVVKPDLTCCWKDEREFQDLIDLRIFSHATEVAVRQAGQEVINRAQNRESPFNEGWEDWTPDRDRPKAKFPMGWKNFPSLPTKLPCL